MVVHEPTIKKPTNPNSSVFYINDDEFGFWKIGEKPRDVGKINLPSCFGTKVQEARPWYGGNVLLIGDSDCRYVELNTTTGEGNEISLEEKTWLNDCDDMGVFGGEFICFKVQHKDARYGVLTYSDKTESAFDSLIWDGNPYYLDDFLTISGDYLLLGRKGDKKAIANTKPISVLKPYIWINAWLDEFIDDSGNKILYGVDNLIVTE